MGFRSYIGKFLVAILMLFRPSLPWCFPIHPFLWVSEVTLGNNNNRTTTTTTTTTMMTPGFLFYRWGVLPGVSSRYVGLLGLPFPSSRATVFPCRGQFRFQKSSRSRGSSRRKQEEKVAKINPFLWVSEVTLGSFWSQFWCFSVLHCHGVFPSGGCLLNRRSSRSRGSSSSRRKK